jgi:hypothetical protein
VPSWQSLTSNSLYIYFFCVVLFSFFYLGTKWLVEGKKKDAAYLASLFDPWIPNLDPRNSRFDCVFFMEQAAFNKLASGNFD